MRIVVVDLSGGFAVLGIKPSGTTMTAEKEREEEGEEERRQSLLIVHPNEFTMKA